LKSIPKLRKVREGGKWSDGWLYFGEREREVREDGRLSKGKLNRVCKSKSRDRREEGRWSRG
jgi:hypothetical protein